MTIVQERHPNVDAVVKTFDLAEQPVDLYLREMNGDLDYGRLTFGKRYHAVQSFAANRSGEVRRNEKLHFLGQYIFPYTNGLRLFFERADRTKLILEFEGDFQETPNRVRMISDFNLNDYFKPVTFDFSKRSSRLMAARAVIMHHREKGLT